MPVMDGLEATKQIKLKIEAGEICYVPVIALTANVKYEKNEYIATGMVDVITKPIEEKKLSSMIGLF